MRENKIPLFWATPEHDLVANALGYNTHNKYMRKHSEPFFNYDEKAEIALTIAPGNKFHPIPGKFNVLFTMWEFLDVPPSYIEGINRADALIVPCKFCKDVFSGYFPKDRIYVCHEGVDPDLYKFKQRVQPNAAGAYRCEKCKIGGAAMTGMSIPCKKCGKKLTEIRKGERFRFLWLGAPNPRKGYPFLLEMVKIFENVPGAEIYLKTTMPKLTWWTTIKNTWKKRKKIFKKESRERMSLWRMIRRIPKPYYNERVVTMGKYKNVFLDTRKLPTNELIDLYHSAHCFVMPHLGEGWGLTLCEAMATGCPSISVAETGCKDFFDEKVGYPLKTAIISQDLREDYDLPEARAYVPNTKDLLEKMTYVMANYGEAAKKGKLASDRIRSKFTWDLAGKRLRDVIDEIIEDRGLNVGAAMQEAGV